MVVVAAQFGGIRRKIRIVHEPDRNRNAQAANARNLLQVILREDMQPVHHQHRLRRFADSGLQHVVRRGYNQFGDESGQRFGDACIYGVKALGDIHQLQGPLGSLSRRILRPHRFAQAETVALAVTVAVAHLARLPHICFHSLTLPCLNLPNSIAICGGDS
ncbi:hypothetical protein D3C71_1276360 [compost metagenome]